MPRESSSNDAAATHNDHPIAKTAVLVPLLTVTSLAAQLALHPLYGSYATSLYHPYILFGACFASMFLPRLPERATLVALASWMGFAPHASYVLGVLPTKRWHEPKAGVVLAHAAMLIPLLAPSVSLIDQWNYRLSELVPGPIRLDAYVAFIIFQLIYKVEPWLYNRLPLGGLVNSSNIFFASAAALTLFNAFLPAPTPPPSRPRSENKGKARTHVSPFRTFGRILALLLPAIAAATAFSRPPAATPDLPYTRNSTTSIESPATIRLLAREHGPTGLVVVGEHVEEEFRFLRVDHSLLGGRWFGDKVAPDARNGLGDSIYTTFVLQEAARLVKRKKQDEEQERALFIGLGIGVATEAFIAHGINTSVVEIDPVVYKFAREFFGLPEPAYTYFEDARSWVQEHQEEKFDYVIHDTFSGGGVSGHLYTVEFWAMLQNIVKPDGVVAVNFAGEMGSDAAIAIYLTLRQSFGKCRAFHDQINARLDDEYSFFNVVYFCTSKGAPRPQFRDVKEKDFLESHIRLHIFAELSKREMKARTILGNVSYVNGTDDVVVEADRWVLHDKNNLLGKWQEKTAVEHWNVMREVLPDIFWETY